MNVATLRQEESYGSSWLACSLRMAAAAAPIFVPTRWYFHVWLRALGYVLPTGGVLLDSGLFVRKRAEARIGRGAIAVSCGLGRVRPSRATEKSGGQTQGDLIVEQASFYRGLFVGVLLMLGGRAVGWFMQSPNAADASDARTAAVVLQAVVGVGGATWLYVQQRSRRSRTS